MSYKSWGFKDTQDLRLHLLCIYKLFVQKLNFNSVRNRSDSLQLFVQATLHKKVSLRYIF